ncbi:hypothetical protein HY642_02970 [Candidatus Woesearchaeota archaeon]|nr:hypothetical protein [Candidatus Woesearchaeota archaeon]
MRINSAGRFISEVVCSLGEVSGVELIVFERLTGDIETEYIARSGADEVFAYRTRLAIRQQCEEYVAGEGCLPDGFEEMLVKELLHEATLVHDQLERYCLPHGVSVKVKHRKEFPYGSRVA